MIRKIYRKFFEKTDVLVSKLRILHLRIKYPKLNLSWDSYIGQNCKIVCDDDSKMNLKSVYISNNVTMTSSKGGTINIVSSFIGANCVVVATKQVKIEEGCEIAEMVVIRDQNHNFDFSSKPISKQGFSSKPISIGKNVWIGAKATILKGCNIGDNSLIAAHSLVNKTFPSQSFIVGTPARLMNRSINK